MASFIKSKLKTARDALGKKDFKAAEEVATQVLDYEPTNYNANVFLGLACLELGELVKSEQAYIKATESSPEQVLAWQGLSKFYERTQQWPKYATVLRRTIDLFSQQEEFMKCAEALQKYIDLQRSHGTRQQIINALSLLLPSSPLYPALSLLPEPEPTASTSTTTYAVQVSMQNCLPIVEEIISLTEKEEEEKIKKEVDRRRMRLGADKPEKIRNEVGREVWGSSTLPSLYDEILNHPNTSDDLRRSTESKLFRRKYKHLKALPATGNDVGMKQRLLSEVEDLSSGAVLLRIPDELAWIFFIESKNAYHLEDYDFRTLSQFIEIFPSLPLARMVLGYFQYMQLPVDLATGDEEESSDILLHPDKSAAQTDIDPFTSILDASADLLDSLLAHRILSELYRIEADYENAIKAAETGLALLDILEDNYGKLLPRVRRAFQVVLAVGLVNLYPPKHHTRSMEVLAEVLSQEPHNIPCLMGRGCVLQYSGQWSQAEEIFRRVDDLEPDHDVRLEAREERAWCIVKDGRLQEGIPELEAVVKSLDDEEGKEEQKARAWWRLGKSLWDSGEEGKEIAYKYFITSLKRSSTFAPAFTSLGIYYAEVASPADLDRSSKCFQKAFELDAREGDAARRLAEGFAEEREWDLVEVVARRTIEGEGGLEGGDAGRNTTTSAGYLPTHAWAWKAVGIVELHRRNYPSATQSFQVALRVNEDDFLSWQRLGESYAKSGRHAAAIKALKRALELQPDDWMCSYLLGDVYRLMGQYTDAVEILEDILEDHPREVCVLLLLADTHLSHARSQSAEGFRTRAEASVVASIQVALQLLDKNPGFRRVTWKVAADAVFELSRFVSFDDTASVASTLASLAVLISVPEGGKFINELLDFPLVIESETVDGLFALQLAVAAYDYRISLDNLDDNATAAAWFDLGVALLVFSRKIKNPAKSATATNQAKQLIQKALKTDSGNDAYWNLLGSLEFIENPKVSQHAFIKALECDTKNVLTWTNIGLLYLHHGDLEIANEALFRAQTLDPDYVLAWVGQGLVATANGHHVESYALFAHAVELTADVPAANLEFSKRAFTRLTDPTIIETPASELLIPSFHALDRYCKQQPNEPAALHLFALVCERLDRIELALDLVSRSILLLERSYEDTEDTAIEEQFAIANGTLGRLRLATGKFAGAVEGFTSALSLLPTDDGANRTKTLRAHGQFGSGLANFRLGELEVALGMFETALEELPSGMLNVRGHVTVLLTQTLWALRGDEARKAAQGQLLECISADPENLTAMTVLVAMGILDSDDSLVNAALSEIQAMTLDKRADLDPGRIVSRLVVQHHLAQSHEEEALSETQRAMHTQPLDNTARRALASLLLQRRETVAAAAIIAGNQNAHHRDSLDNTLRVAAIATATDKRSHGRAMQFAQKSIFIAPWTVDNWRSLAYVRCVGVKF